MTTAPHLLAKLGALARWEKRKRREETLLAAGCAALAAAVFLLPLNSLLPYPWLRWVAPLILLAGFAPGFLYRRRWTVRDEVLVLTTLDRELKLDERAVTAWDLARRGKGSPAAQLVFQQTERKLAAIEPQTLFPRRRQWPHVFAPALLAIWLALLWLEVDRREDGFALQPLTLAQRARDYARELQERARNENLRQSLKMGHELEKAARQEIERKHGDESFKKQLSALAKKFDDSAKAQSANDFAAAESGQALKDLHAEIAALRDLPELPSLPKGAEEADRRWAERLVSMPQLKRRLNDAEQSGQSFGQSEFKSFLNQLEKRVSGELDRRALIDAQEYLKQMMKQGTGETENFAHRSQAPAEDQELANGQREKNASTLPGKEPGEKSDAAPSLPEFRAGVSTQIKGALGEGESTGLSFKGKPAPGKSAVPSEEVVTSYRRQAEQELESERVPAALKETIKNYFLSLGDGAGAKAKSE